MYRIRWDDTAINEILAQSAVAESVVQDAIIAASLDIDTLLAEQPEIAGESREPGVRVLIVNPLTVRFHVNQQLREVVITAVRVHQRRSP